MSYDSRQWQGRGYDARPFACGKTALQLYSRSEYQELKDLLSWRVDKWNREKNISFGLTQYFDMRPKADVPTK